MNEMDPFERQKNMYEIIRKQELKVKHYRSLIPKNCSTCGRSFVQFADGFPKILACRIGETLVDVTAIQHSFCCNQYELKNNL